MSIRPPLKGDIQSIWDNYLENAETVTPPFKASIKQVILVDTAGTISLPPANDAKHGYHIKNLSTGSVVIDPDGSETIDNSATYTISTQYASVHVISDGTAWYLI